MYTMRYLYSNIVHSPYTKLTVTTLNSAHLTCSCRKYLHSCVNLPLTQVLVFEDAPNGVAAAKAAGMSCVMVPDRRTDPEKCKQADSVISSLELLDLAEWGLPPLQS